MGKIMDFFVWIGLLKGEERIFYIGGSSMTTCYYIISSVLFTANQYRL